MKCYTLIGFKKNDNESVPGVTKEKIIELPYYGEVIRNARRVQSSDKINDDLTISNQISLLLDPYLNENYYNIAYLTFMGRKWKVGNIEMRYPRIIIDIGGLYNEQEDEDSSNLM